jgi:hypothetical protein
MMHIEVVLGPARLSKTPHRIKVVLGSAMPPRTPPSLVERQLQTAGVGKVEVKEVIDVFLLG